MKLTKRQLEALVDKIYRDNKDAIIAKEEKQLAEAKKKVTGMVVKKDPAYKRMKKIFTDKLIRSVTLYNFIGNNINYETIYKPEEYINVVFKRLYPNLKTYHNSYEIKSRIENQILIESISTPDLDQLIKKITKDLI